jgi:hypothetical protein
MPIGMSSADGVERVAREAALGAEIVALLRAPGQCIGKANAITQLYEGTGRAPPPASRAAASELGTSRA